MLGTQTLPPPPSSCTSLPHVLWQGCAEVGCRMMGEGGGSGGRGVGRRARPSATPGWKPWALLSWAVCYPHHMIIPLLPRMCLPSALTSEGGGGHTLEGGGDGWVNRRLNPPAPTPACSACQCSWRGSLASGTSGGGAPPASPSRCCPSCYRSNWSAGVEWWGRGRGRSGIVGPPSIPPSLGTTPKK